MGDQALELMDVDEFLAWHDGTDTRHELANGVVRSIAPPTGAHGTIASNINGVLYNTLLGRRPCRPQAEAGVRINRNTMWQADIGVTCRPPAPEILEPKLVVEVLSPSTRMHDLGQKLQDHKTLPSVMEIWMVDSERRWVQLWRRKGDHWIANDLAGSAAFDSPVAGTVVELEDIYADSRL